MAELKLQQGPKGPFINAFQLKWVGNRKPQPKHAKPIIFTELTSSSTQQQVPRFQGSQRCGSVRFYEMLVRQENITSPRFFPPRLCRDLHPICGWACYREKTKKQFKGGSGISAYFSGGESQFGKPQKKGDSFSLAWLQPSTPLCSPPRHTRAGDGLQRVHKCRVCWLWVNKFPGFLGASTHFFFRVSISGLTGNHDST